MRATIDHTVIAEAADAELIHIEGNIYFPPSSVQTDRFVDSATQYTCPWKGAARYYNLQIGAELHHDAAWSYPQPYSSAVDRVTRDFTGYVAFDTNQVTVE